MMENELDALVANSIETVADAIAGNVPYTPAVDAALKVVLQYMKNLKAELKPTADPTLKAETMRKIRRIDEMLKEFSKS